MSEKTSSTRGWLLPVGLAAVVVTLVAIALTRGPVELDPDTAEGAVQEYLLAINEKRWEDAIEVLHPQWRGECTGDDLASFANFDFTAQLSDGGSNGGFGGAVVREEFAVITTVGEFDDAQAPPDEELPGSDIQVEVIISRNDEGPFGSSWDEYVYFELIDEDDFWWISGDPWPYFTWECRA